MRFSNGPSVLIVDELGYLPMPAEDANALFQVISQRYLRGSIILTTNRSVASWGEIFADTTVAAARRDRLLHRSVSPKEVPPKVPWPAGWGISASNPGESQRAASSLPMTHDDHADPLSNTCSLRPPRGGRYQTGVWRDCLQGPVSTGAGGGSSTTSRSVSPWGERPGPTSRRPTRPISERAATNSDRDQQGDVIEKEALWSATRTPGSNS
jgi:hypothetical protein